MLSLCKMLYVVVLVIFSAYIDFIAMVDIKTVKYETRLKTYLSTTSDFHTLGSRSITECAVHCEEIDICVAFNFYSNASCILARYSANGQTKHKVYGDGWTYIKPKALQNYSSHSENSAIREEGNPQNNSENSTIHEESQPQKNITSSGNSSVHDIDPQNNSKNSTIHEESQPRNNITNSGNSSVHDIDPQNNSENGTNHGESQPQNNSASSESSPVRDESKLQNNSTNSENSPVGDAIETQKDSADNGKKSGKDDSETQKDSANNGKKSGKDNSDECRPSDNYEGIKRKGVCYFWKRKQVAKQWKDGRDDCRDHGAELVCIESAKEDNALATIIPKKEFWIGLSKPKNLIHPEPCMIDFQLYTNLGMAAESKFKDDSTACAVASISERKTISWKIRKCSTKIEYVCEL